MVDHGPVGPKIASQSGLPFPASIQSGICAGFMNTSTMWWQGAKPSCSRASLVESVPVRPSPEPITFSAMTFPSFVAWSVAVLRQESTRAAHAQALG
jgi:hypothetical protein